MFSENASYDEIQIIHQFLFCQVDENCESLKLCAHAAKKSKDNKGEIGGAGLFSKSSRWSPQRYVGLYVTP